MSNPFFNNVITLTPGTKARAPDVEDKFTMVSNGFDAVNLAILAAYAGPGTQGTSTTSLTIGNGSKSFVTQPGLSFLVGLDIKLASAANVANYMTGALTAYNPVTGAATVQVSAYSGSGTFADWSVFAFKDTRTLIARNARSTNITLSQTENSEWIDIVSGTFSQTFDPCAILGNAWWCILSNSGTGEITLEPNGAELIDGLTNYIMYPGEARMVICDAGLSLRTIILKGFSTTYSAGVSTFTKPPGYSQFGGLAWAGGGSGGKSGSANNTGGGGGGACVPFTLPAASFGASELVTVGAGGAAVGAAGNGNPGGSTTIGSLVTAFGGGAGGGNGAADRYGGSGGGALSAGLTGTASPVIGGSPTFSTASELANFGFGGGASGGASAYGGAGGSIGGVAAGSSLYGGAGGAGGAAAPAAAGTSKFGGSGGAGGDAASGTAGTVPGGGGGGTRTGATSGAGAAGQLRIWGIA